MMQLAQCAAGTRPPQLILQVGDLFLEVPDVSVSDFHRLLKSSYAPCIGVRRFEQILDGLCKLFDLLHKLFVFQELSPWNEGGSKQVSYKGCSAAIHLSFLHSDHQLATSGAAKGGAA